MFSAGPQWSEEELRKEFPAGHLINPEIAACSSESSARQTGQISSRWSPSRSRACTQRLARPRRAALLPPAQEARAQGAGLALTNARALPGRGAGLPGRRLTGGDEPPLLEEVLAQAGRRTFLRLPIHSVAGRLASNARFRGRAMHSPTSGRPEVTPREVGGQTNVGAYCTRRPRRRGLRRRAGRERSPARSASGSAHG